MYNKVFNNRYLKKRASDINYRSKRKTESRNRLRAQFGGEHQAPLKITVDDLKVVIMRSGGKCEWCDSFIADTPEFDHILPYRLKDDNAQENLVAACRSCNRRKAQKHPARFALEIYSETGKITSAIRRLVFRYSIIPLMQAELVFVAYEATEDVGTKAA